MASHHTDSHGLFLLSRRYFFITNYSFVTRRVTESLSIPNYRIIEFFFTRRIADGHGGFICHEFANLRIVLHTENCGWSRRIYLSRISELANYSSHGESRTVTEDLSIPNLRISELFFTRRIADGHGGFLWHEAFTLDILNNGKEYAN